MADIKTVFGAHKLTENGDDSFNTTGNALLDILFMSEYFTVHPDEVKIGDSDYERLFAMFMRDPRYGLGRKQLGRTLLKKTGALYREIVQCGRYDDLWKMYDTESDDFKFAVQYLRERITDGDNLAKKWMPRFGSKDKVIASKIAKMWGITKQEYGKFIKIDTVEKLMTDHLESRIEFEHVPSLAHIKYAHAFANKEHTKKKYEEYLEAVRSGEKKLNVSVTTPYDVFRNAEKIDADVFFDKLEKIEINAIPIIDTSGSMVCSGDPFGKALAIGHYLAKCSTFMPDYAIPFSSSPILIHLGDNTPCEFEQCKPFKGKEGRYYQEIRSLYTGDCSNTNFGAVMDLLKQLSVNKLPEWLVVLSDMEFDYGSNRAKNQLEALWNANGGKTKFVWWNLNGRNKTCPEMDSMGNVYMSGYSPMLLKYLEAGFDGEKFLNKLLEEYGKKIN